VFILIPIEKIYTVIIYYISYTLTGGADKSLARSTSRCILLDGENTSFEASLVTYIYIYVCIHIYV
jgi:hypothetical protein